MAISRAYEKCLTGLTCMVRGTGTIQERLAAAFLQHLRHIDPDEDLTPALEQQFLEMKGVVTARAPEHEGESRIEATTREMSEQEAQDAADIFIAFAANVSAVYHEDERLRCIREGEERARTSEGRDAA